MQFVKVVLQGDYYDSYLYAGFLYLWTVDGYILSFDWKALITQEVIEKLPAYLHYIAEVALLDNRFCYTKEWSLLTRDESFVHLYNIRLEQLVQVEISISEDQLHKYRVSYNKNDFLFPHADALVYANYIYVGSKNGISVGSRNAPKKTPIKFWDGNVFGVDVHSGFLALAAGSEGVYEYPVFQSFDLQDIKDKKRLQQKSKQSSITVRWMYGSLFSSHYASGYFLNLENPDKPKKISKIKKLRSEPRRNKGAEKEIVHNKVVSIIDAQEIFVNDNQVELLWGAEDKLCLLEYERVNIKKYRDSETPSFDTMDFVSLSGKVPTYAGATISADTTYFGYVIEKDNGLVVVLSNNEIVWIENEPTKWRVFPRSYNYTNQLHIVYDDNLTILSFNHDYLIDQRKKNIGISKDLDSLRSIR